MLFAYRHPERLADGGSGNDWVQWIFRLRRRDKRHAIELVEGWNTKRIAIAGSIPWISSWLVAIIWTSLGGDPQTTFTAAGFILTSSSGKNIHELVISSKGCVLTPGSNPCSAGYNQRDRIFWEIEHALAGRDCPGGAPEDGN
jgi:hypothetical protein